MRIFRKAKSNQSSASSEFPYWSEKEILHLAERLAGKRPHLGFDVTGIRHCMQMHAVEGARTEQEAHREISLNFDERPQDERRLSLVDHDHEVTGWMDYPRARVECGFSVGKSEDIEVGKLGSLLINSIKAPDNPVGYHVVEAHFFVESDEQRAEMLRTLQAGAGSTGRAYIDFLLWPIESADDWVAKFKSDECSPSVGIKAAFVTSGVGRGAVEHWPTRET